MVIGSRTQGDPAKAEADGVEKMPRADVRVPGAIPDAEVTHVILPGKARTTFNKRVPVPETDTGR